VSKSVADYYCAVRGIPTANKVPVKIPSSLEVIPPDVFRNRIAVPLRRFLQIRAGIDPDTHPDQLPDLATDPTKCIVLCTGIPVLISGNGITCSVDSSLSLLFNKTEWGHLPITGYPAAGAPYFLANPYCEKHSDATKDVDPAQRTIPADFGEFRANPACNSTLEPATDFTTARIMDSTSDSTLRDAIPVAAAHCGAMCESWMWFLGSVTPVGLAEDHRSGAFGTGLQTAFHRGVWFSGKSLLGSIGGCPPLGEASVTFAPASRNT